MSTAFQFHRIIPFTLENSPVQVGFSMLVRPDTEAWKEHVSRLADAEQEQLFRMRTDAARNSFCLGRMAARGAAALLAGEVQAPFAIAHGVFGYPVITPNPRSLSLSIAHTDTSALALCYPEQLMMGADIEKISAAGSPVMRSSFTEQEQQMQLPGISEILTHHLLWSAREALSKALRTGFLVPLPMLEVRSIQQQEHLYHIDFVHFHLFRALAFEAGSYLVALVYPRKATPSLQFVRSLQEECGMVHAG